jgi:UDP-2,3-diacylglucosamine hydrolase
VRDSIIFLSDTHFSYHTDDEKERKKRALFLEFLSRIEGVGSLYLLGDIFDFWFEYRSVAPKYYHDILDGLNRLTKGGSRVSIMGGNHDYWLGSYISETLGMTVLPQLVTHELQGRRITMTHGDMLLPGDLAYKTLKAVTRNPFVISIARLVHPDILYGLARNFSRASKGVTHKKTQKVAGKLLEIAPDRFFEWGNDTFVMGHVHLPRMESFGDRIFVMLGDWEEHFSYLLLKGGNLSLECYGTVVPTLSESR